MEDHYQKLLSTVPGVVYALDEEGRFTYLSDILQTVLGYSQSDLLGHHFSKIIHPDDIETVSRKFVLPRFTGIPTGSERAPKLFDERRACPRKTSDLQVRLKARPMVNDEEELVLLCKVNAAGQYNEMEEGKARFRGTMGLIFDITQEESDISVQNIRKKYSVLDLLSQALSHAFSNVFTGIYGNLQLIEMHLDGKEVVVPNIEAIKNSVEKAVVLIKQMKQIISDVGKQQENLDALIREVALEVFAETKYDFNCSTEPYLWRVEPDPDYVRHILRSIFYFIHHNMDEMSGTITINMSNLQENSGILPRFDCKYLKVEIVLPEIGFDRSHSNFQVMEGCNEKLQKISAMALSYSLLKKIGAEIDVTYSERPVINLYIPAMENVIEEVLV